MDTGQLLVIDTASIPQSTLMKRAGGVAAALKLDVFICCLRDEADQPPLLPGKRERVEKVRERLLSRCRRALGRRLDEMRAEGIDADGCVTRTGSTKDTALELVREREPELVMIARRPHTRMEQATLSAEDFAIVRESVTPVWVVHPSADAGGDRIVGAVGQPEPGADAPSLDERILDEVCLLSEKLGKERHALHAFGNAGTVSPELKPAAEDPGDDMGTSRNDARMGKVLDFAAAHGVAREHTHIYEGRLERVLEEESEALNADLIVLGESSDSRLRRIVSGGTVEHVIEHADTDVLVMKDRERQNTPAG